MRPHYSRCVLTQKMGKVVDVSSSSTSTLTNVESLSRKSSLNHIVTSTSSGNVNNETCRVCGDGNAKTHYGVVTCFGCKGFFRRTLKRPSEYSCRHNGNCVVDRHERNSCRFCRFKKCLEVGMDPKAVRPDRDATGRHYQGRQRRSKLNTEDGEGEVDAEWMRKLPVDMRTTLMQLLNIDLIVGGGDGHTEPSKIYPLPFDSIRKLLEDPSILDGKRTEMRYEAFRQINPDELPCIAHRRLIAMIDWADHLFDMMDVHNMDDKLAIVKHSYAPLMIFSLCANTARHKTSDIVCMSTFGYIGRYAPLTWQEPYHFGNHMAERCLDEIIDPLRKLALKEEEITLLKAIIILNPHLKSLSAEASDAIMDLRDRIQEALYHVVRETHPKEVASSRFGNLLLLIPSVVMLGKLAIENLSFVDSFGQMNDRLMHDLLSDPKINENQSPTHGMDTSPVGINMTTSSQDEQQLTINPNTSLPIGLPRRHSEPRMVHSSSSSSVESLASYPSSSNGSYEDQMGSIPYNLSCNSLPTHVNDFDVSLNAAASMPNLEMTECDPDYNLTITPDMYTDMRQAMTAANGGPMDTEESGKTQNGVVGVEDGSTPPMSQQQQQQQRRDSLPPQSPTHPMFYISTVESKKHKFTVTTTSYDNRFPQGAPNFPDGYHPPPLHQNASYSGQIADGILTNPEHQQTSNGHHHNQQQQTLCKTNSLPPQYMQSYEMNGAAGYDQQMECDDGNFINFNPG